MIKEIEIKELRTDVFIIGGGTAGCYAALTLAQNPKVSVLIADKANIKRSGCLAAGVNAINAYIVKGKRPEDYVDYAVKDAGGIAREDLLLTMTQGLNTVTKRLEELGLVILKDDKGEYMARGDRNIKINGENIKVILANAVNKSPNVKVLNHVNVIDYIVIDHKIYGALAIDVYQETLYVIYADKVICATGGASGLYKPNNPGFSRHKIWYPPFNTGAGYAMGIRAGAEMTTFEMRFIALRCKDTIAPTGTIAQGVGAKQINSLGEVYEAKYGLTTSERVYGTVRENLEGRGPCYLKTVGISPKQDEELKKAYLNMAPSQTLKWIEEGKNPSEQNVEIEGTEPYIVGGHTASGYWVDTYRRTTIDGLYAAGDVAGGCPQKYVTGAMVEGEIAAKTILWELEGEEAKHNGLKEKITSIIEARKREIETILNRKQPMFSVEEVEEAMQKVMDAYAGGIGSHYQYNSNKLKIAEGKIRELIQLSEELAAEDMHELLFVYELKDRLILCLSVIAHLEARKETRWYSFADNLDYPHRDDNWLKYVNSIYKNGQIQIILRDLVGREDVYEHNN